MESIVRKPLLLVSFTFVNLLEYCDVINAAHACENDYRHVIIKGQTLFKEHFVTDIRFKSDEEICCYYVQARVKAEMKKRYAYNVTGVISYNGKVIEGECQCAGGWKPTCCKHRFGLLSALEDYSRKEMYAAPTDKIQTWHQPAPKAILPQKTKDSFRCDKTGLTNFDTSVSMSALAALPQNTPIFSVLQADPKKINL